MLPHSLCISLTEHLYYIIIFIFSTRLKASRGRALRKPLYPGQWGRARGADTCGRAGKPTPPKLLAERPTRGILGRLPLSGLLGLQVCLTPFLGGSHAQSQGRIHFLCLFIFQSLILNFFSQLLSIYTDCTFSLFIELLAPG